MARVKWEISITRLQSFVHDGVAFRTDSYLQIQLLFDRSGSQPQLAGTWRANKENMRGSCAAPPFVLIWWRIKMKENAPCARATAVCAIETPVVDRRSTVKTPSPPCSGDRRSPLPGSDLPEQTGERMRGGAVPAAVAASTGARRAAAGARRLPLPGQELLHRGEIPRPRRVEKFLLLPHGEPHGIRRRERGGLACREWNSSSPFSLSLSPPSSRPQVKFSALLARWRGNKSSPCPLAASLRIHGAAGAGGGGRGGKVSLSTTIPPPPPPSKLPLTSPGSLVRHFLETAVPRVYNRKSSRRRTHARTHAQNTQLLAPPP